MRRILLTATTAFVIGGIATGAVLSRAQPAPPSAGMAGPALDAPPLPPGTMPRPAMRMGWRHGPGSDRPVSPRDFALIYRQPDRQLTPADVQKIAEGFLLWNGNHGWKVTNVAPTPDGPIGFSLATPEGSMIARFTIDPHSGKLARIG